jgi:tripartite-type tricarboxylate transporter receptor subunit TctC
MIRRRLLLFAAFHLGLFATSPVLAAGEPYPARPIRLIAPFPAGGPVDVMARLIAQQLSARLGQVIVDNRPGAGATLGAKSVAQADPDGYTLLLGSSASLGIGPALYPGAGYDPVKSFVPIALVSDVPYVMVAAVKAPFRGVPELVAFARTNPGKLNFGVPNGAPPHMLALMFRQLTRADIAVVPYRGAATVITDLIGGQIDLGFETTSVMFSHLHEGKVRGLAVVSAQRLPQLPDLPTMRESGVPDLTGSSWTGIMAPAGTPPDIVARLRDAIIESLKSRDMTERFAALGAQARFPSREEFGQFIATEADRLAKVIQLSGAKGE